MPQNPNQTLALIHTSPTLTPLFTDLCTRQMPDVRIFHMVDESLIKETVRVGSLQKLTIRRLIAMIESAAGGGADAVMVTCSSIGEGVSLAQKIFDFPIIRVDEAMAEAAIQSGSRLGVLATLRTTLEPTSALLRTKAARANKPVELVECLCNGAFEAVLSGDTATHDRIVGSALVNEMASVDAVVLAQASMARVVNAMPPDAVKVPVFSSPELAVRRAHDVLRQLAGANA